MKKTVTFGVLAATALTLAACKGEATEAPAAAPTAEATEAAPVDDAAALNAATAGAEGTDPNNNPVPPASGDAAPAEGEAAPAAE
jgi:hypothetical protein